MSMALLKRHRDLLVLALLTFGVLVYAGAFINFDAPPFEDAAMLMRYADHLARGYGIVWNIGEPPVDGATDFLFMVLAAGLIKSGMTVGRTVRVLGFGAHLLTVWLVYGVNRRVWRANVPLSLFSALYLAVGNGLSYVAAYFGTPFFALFAALSWTLALLLIQRERPSTWLSLLFALSALLGGLIRPEGVILAGLMLVAVIVARGWKTSRPVRWTFLAVFIVLGGAYFLWRWNYFGHPLPNPFYKKGAGLLYMDSFQESLGNMLRLAAPFWPAFLLGFRAPRTTRLSLAFLLPLLGFASAFILISNETNFGARFQYALLPLVLLAWPPLVDGLGGEVGLSWPRPPTVRERIVWILAALSAGLALLLYSASQKCYLVAGQESCASPSEGDGRYEVARILADYRDKGYVMATSEAGLLPFYSGWTAVDTWGLNDAWIARYGEVTPEYLDRYRPHLIVFHAYYSPVFPPKASERNMAQAWFRMTITLKDYAEQRGYILAAAFGHAPDDVHYYYVRPDFADSARLAKQIASIRRYIWWTDGRPAINYAKFSLP